VCPNKSCIEHAKSLNLVQVALNIKAGDIYIHLAEQINRNQNNSIEKLLGFAARSQNLMFGVTSVKAGVENGKINMIIIDHSASPSTQKRIESFCLKMNIPYLFYTGKRPFEKVVGKTNCRCAGITDSKFAQSILKGNLSQNNRRHFK